LFLVKYLAEIALFILLLFLLSSFFSWHISPALWPQWLRGVDAVLVLSLFVVASFAEGGK